MSREFDRYFVHVDAGTEEKFATLSDAEYRAHIVGVLAVAAKSPMRGYLFVGDLEAQPVHIARRAGVTERIAASAMRKLKEVGVLVRDEEVGAWRVHNWEKHQSERRDPTAAKRAADYRARRAASREPSRDATGGSDADPRDASRSPSREARESLKGLEVEKEEVEANASTSEPSRPDVDKLCHLLADLIRRNDPKAKVDPDGKRWRAAARLLIDTDRRTVDEIEQVIRWCQADRFWQSNVLSMPKLREKFQQLALRMRTEQLPSTRPGAGPSAQDFLAAGGGNQ